MSISAELSEAQVRFVLDRAVSNKKLNKRDIDRYLGEAAKEVAELEERIAELRHVAKGATGSASGAAKAKAKKKTSKKTSVSRKLQGQYLSLIRQLPKNQRTRIKKIVATDGREKAIETMKAALTKK